MTGEDYGLFDILSIAKKNTNPVTPNAIKSHG
jgi:hypothetical protein